MSREIIRLIQTHDFEFQPIGKCRLVMKLPNNRAIVVKSIARGGTIENLLYDIDLTYSPQAPQRTGEKEA